MIKNIEKIIARAITEVDVDEVMEIEKYCFKEHRWPTKGTLLKDRAGAVLTTDTGTIQGYVFWRHKDKTLNIERMGVAEAYKGKGLGKVLLALVEMHAKITGVLHMTLHVRGPNREARRLYCSFQFEEDGKPGKYKNGDEKISMKKQVRREVNRVHTQAGKTAS